MTENKKKKSKLPKRLGIIIIIGILIFFGRKSFLKDGKILTGDSNIRDLKFIDSINTEGFSNVKLYDNQMILWSDEIVRFSSLQGKSEPVDLNGIDKKVICGKSYIYIIDNVGKNVKVMNIKGEEVETLFFNKKIFNVYEDKKNLIVHLKDKTIETLVFINEKGSVIKEHSVENENILTYNMSDSNKGYILSTLEIENRELSSTLNQFNLKGERLWKLELTDEVIMKSELINNSILLLTDSNLHSIKDGKIQWSKRIDDLEDLEINDNKVYILYNNTLEIINLDGRTISKMSLEKDYSKISKYDRFIILYGDRNILGIDDDKKVLEYGHKNEIENITNNSGYIGLKTENQLELFKLVNKR